MATKVKINKNVVDDIKEKFDKYSMDIALEVEEEARRLCPKDSGRLANSIETRIKDDDTLSIGSDVPYAIIVEKGSRNQRAQPFLRSALSIVDSKHQE